MTETERKTRQNELAEWVGTNLLDCSKLIPLGGHSSFSSESMPLHENYYDARICDAVWWAVGHILGNIDHAWLFGFPTGPKEPWGLITEPYMDQEKARTVVKSVNEKLMDWGVMAHALPTARSSWNPGGCIPIVAYVEKGCYRQFIAHAVKFLAPVQLISG